jgi:RNA polymerase sigma factor (sigma-70 family)
MPESDASLVRIAASGDTTAFSELLRRHGKAIHAYLARRGGRDAADDLLAEVWVRAYAARKHYDQQWEDARPWLYGIARNVLREHWRRAGTARADDEFTRRAAAAEDPWPDIDARLDAAAELSRLRQALARLAAADREVLLLVTWEGLTPAEAAVALSIPPGTARSRLHRARETMRQFLDGEHADQKAASDQEAGTWIRSSC